MKWLEAFLVATLLGAAVARAEDITPRISPDRIDDVPSTKPDPFPAFTNFAWRAFVAVSWPARGGAAHRGEPDTAKRLSDPGPRVWETFKAKHEIEPLDEAGHASPAAPWASLAGTDPCGYQIAAGGKTLATYEPFADFNQASFAPGRAEATLVARNRTYVRYETRVNAEEYRALTALTGALSPATVVHLPTGSIAVKAAWRILTDADTPATRARYYVVHDARVVDVAATIAAGRTRCSVHDIALVGLHVAVKTLYRPQWIWSTFEHTDNTPPMGPADAIEPDARAEGAPYSFYDNHIGQTRLSEPTPPVSLAQPPALDPEPAQVPRLHPIPRQIMAMNRAYWALPGIKGTIWSHYMLVATQWPTVIRPESPDNDGRYFPGLTMDRNAPRESYQSSGDAPEPDFNLANVTMETFLQDNPASCAACHQAVANSRGLDFAGILAGRR